MLSTFSDSMVVAGYRMVSSCSASLIEFRPVRPPQSHFPSVVTVVNGRAPDLKDVPPCLDLHSTPVSSPVTCETSSHDHPLVPLPYPVLRLKESPR